jgi:hypothetical protein
MSRLLLLLVALLAFLPLACRLPPDREPLRPLPEDGLGLTYGELIGRARSQLNIALDAFYLDSWKELEDVAKGLEQTARFLPRSADPPVSLKDDLLSKSKALREAAIRLGEGARTKNVDMALEALNQVNTHVRALRPPLSPLLEK